MLSVEPSKVTFRDLRLNQPYTTSVCITNPLDVSVNFVVRPNHTRYQVSPETVHLRPGQSIVVSIRVFLSSYPKIDKGSKVDILLIPKTQPEKKHDNTDHSQQQQQQLEFANPSNERLNYLQSLTKDHPDFEKILEERLQIERYTFEEKSQKALALLHAKDEMIDVLRAKINELTQGLKQTIENNSQEPPISTIHLQEMDVLHERIADQAEQIEVLISEISRLRKNENQVEVSHQDEKLREENRKLVTEISQLRTKCHELELLLLEKQTEIPAPNSPSVENEQIFSSSSIRENELLKQLQERAYLAEQELQQYRLDSSANFDMKQNLNEWELQLEERTREISRMVNELKHRENELIRREEIVDQRINAHEIIDTTNTLPLQQQQQQQQLQQSENSDTGREKHEWWKYVWYTLKQIPTPEENANTSSPTTTNHLESQGIEIVTLRQARILDSLRYTELQRKYRDEVDGLKREIDKLKWHIKNHRNDNETKLSELTRTINLLSSKSNLHSEITKSLHDLQLEKLLVENLRRDVETYQSILQIEQNKNEQLRKELLECESSKQRSEILNSLNSIPGISPVKLIEVFSERMISLEKELLQVQSEYHRVSNQPSPPPSPPCNLPLSQSYTNEIKKVLPRKHIEEFLPSLNNALLVQRILDLESLIREQDLQIQDLNHEISTRIGSNPSELILAGDSEFQSGKNEKLLILTQESLAQAKNDIKNLKYQLEIFQERETAANSRLESLSISSICLSCQNKMTSPTTNKSHEINLDEVLENDRNDDEATLFNEDNENLRSLLRERTTQLKILMETLDTLQLNASESLRGRQSHLRTEETEEGEDDFIDESSSDNWEVKVLIKRVISLTSEIAVQHASNEMSNRRLNHLEASSLLLSKKLFESELKIKRFEKGIIRLQNYAESLIERHRGLENNHRRELSLLQSQLDRSMEELKEKEFALNESTVQLEELQKHLSVTNQKSFKQWFLESIPDDTSEPRRENHPQSHTQSQSQSQSLQQSQSQPENGTDDVRDLIISLLVQWRDQVGFYPRGATSAITKAEEKFLQNITNLVVESHHRATQADNRVRAIQLKLNQSEYHNIKKSNQLERIMAELFRYQKKSLNLEEVMKQLSIEKMKSEGGVCTLLRKANQDLTLMVETLTKELFSQQMPRTTGTNLTSKNEIGTNETELKNSLKLEYSAHFEDQIKISEASLRKWFQIELPRLLTGLPIPEEDLQYLSNSSSHTFELSDRVTTLGLDKTYSLSQSICSLKLIQHTTSMKQVELTEMNHLLKSKVLELETLLEEQQHLQHQQYQQQQQQQQQQRFSSDWGEIPQQETFRGLPDLAKLQIQNTKLSENVIELQTKLEYAKSRETSLIKLVETLRENEPKVELEISEGIRLYQQQVEDRYVQDVRDLSETYEAEKQHLIMEIEKLTESYQRAVSSNSIQLALETQDQCMQTEDFLSRHSSHIDANDNGDYDGDYNDNYHHNEVYNYNEDYNDNDNDEKKNKTYHSEQDEPSETHNSSTELSSRELRRLLEIEQSRYQQAQEQIHELEQILESQRSSFRMHLAREREIAVSSMETQTIDSERDGLESSSSHPFQILHPSIPQMKEILQSLDPTTSSPDQINLALQQCIRLLNALQFINERETKKDISLDNSSFSSTHHPENGSEMVPNENLIPDWYFQVLKKLRQRISDLESALPSNISRTNNDSLINNQMLGIKSRYEDALLSTQTALEEQTKLAKDQIERLEDIIQHSKLEHQVSDQQELTYMHTLLNQYKEKLVEQEKAHAEELQGVWNHFQRYREAQDLLTNSLESEIRAQENVKEVTFRENNEKSKEYYELSALCDTKRASLRAVLNALAILHVNTAAEGNQNQHNHETKPLREELLEARLSSADREIVELQRRLEVINHRPKPAAKVPKVIEIEPKISTNIELKKLETLVEDQKNQIHNLKEENTRKTKLLHALKASKSAEATSLEQWKHEFYECEEKLKRVTRSNLSKDAIIKDLRTKLLVFESKDSEINYSEGGGGGGDLAALPLQELRRRLNLSETERGKMRSKLNIYREKISGLETQINQLQEERDQLKKSTDASELLRAEISRKDLSIRNLREALQKSRESLSYTQETSAEKTNELEKQIKSLQRQLDSLRNKCTNLEETNSNLQNQISTWTNRVNKGDRTLPLLDVRSKKIKVEGLTIPMSNEIQEIIAELSVDQDQQDSPSHLRSHQHQHQQRRQRNEKNNEEDEENENDENETYDERRKIQEEEMKTKRNKKKQMTTVIRSEDESINESSNDSVDLQSIERRLKALVHSAMHYDQK